MDLLGGVRAFVAVARRGSFSSAAHDEESTQPVISRRIAALEGRLGGALIERDTRPVSLTSLGSAILGNAHSLIAAEQVLLDTAAAHHRGGVRLLVPRHLDPALWAAVRLRASAQGLELNIEEDERDARSLRFANGEVDAAVLPVESARAEWVVPLGVAQLTERRRLPLSALRPTRARARQAPRIVVLPEDSARALLTLVRETASRYGLATRQVHEANELVPALAGALAGDDWILCSHSEAEAWRLRWFGLTELPLSRAYRLATRTKEAAHVFDTPLRTDIATALSALPGRER